MKVSIITLHYINHYGSLLQTYATCEILRKLGYEPEIVNYTRPNEEGKIALNKALKNKGFSPYSLKGILFLFIKKIENKKRKLFSDHFREKYIPMTRKYQNYNDLFKNPPQADIYMTGSDQTWNSIYNGGVLPSYYLEYAPIGKKRIGFAISIGMNQIPEEEIEETKRYVMKYNAISVRENSSVNLLSMLGYGDAIQIIDPTLALTEKDWEALVAPRMIKEKYVIVYKLNDNPELEKFAEKLAKKSNCKLIRMSYYLNHLKYKGKMIFNPEVEEFLSLIKYADHVVTDSFHCLAFALNFEKSVYVFYPNQYSTRLSSLLELTGAKHRAYGTSDFSEAPIDFEYVRKVLDIERKKVVKFIQENCK